MRRVSIQQRIAPGRVTPPPAPPARATARACIASAATEKTSTEVALADVITPAKPINSDTGVPPVLIRVATPAIERATREIAFADVMTPAKTINSDTGVPPVLVPGAKVRRADSTSHGFTVIEVIVVIGIITLLIALLVPVLIHSRTQARSVQCLSNLRELGLALQIYQNENRGWLYPVDVNPATGNVVPDAFGTSVAPHLRWPMKVFKMRSAPFPPPYNPAAYDIVPYDPIAFPAGPYTPEVLRCPADIEPYEAHSYCLNGHLAEHEVRAGSTNLGGLSTSQVILAGEKVTTQRDYYMQEEDFARVVERFRHGPRLRSNYLYLDGHAAGDRKDRVTLDAWDLRISG